MRRKKLTSIVKGLRGEEDPEEEAPFPSCDCCNFHRFFSVRGIVIAALQTLSRSLEQYPSVSLAAERKSKPFSFSIEASNFFRIETLSDSVGRPISKDRSNRLWMAGSRSCGRLVAPMINTGKDCCCPNSSQSCITNKYKQAKRDSIKRERRKQNSVE